MALGRQLTLNSGYKLPAVGLGTWQSQPNEVERAVDVALKAGYRHIDAALVYGNEQEVGRGIKSSAVPRSEIFVTSKLWNTSHRPADVIKAVDRSLADLQLEYLDLYLIHWPVAFVPVGQDVAANLFPTDPVTDEFLIDNVPIADTWRALEQLVADGKVRSIGVSNFSVEKLQQLLSIAKIPPAVNQVEAHPYLQQPGLLEFAKAHNIVLTAYSPLGNNIYNIPRVVDDPVITQIATELGKQPAQVLISWAVQRGTAVLPKSVTPDRIASNLQDFILPDDAIERINKLEKNLRLNFPVRWGADIFGEVGQDEVTKIAKQQAVERVQNRSK
ncbi:aldo/keto reductase [Lipomyces japonicus]|uniref:aldo/keto reductase n=1 Tax=Lipomyces japonicus TaxID=56871 RepID=UPI0034CDE3C7